MRLAAIASAIVAAMLWGSLGVAYRLGGALGADTTWMALARPLAPSLLALYYILRGLGRPSRFSLAAGVSLALLIPSYLEAVRELGASLAAILLYTAPLWVTILSPLLLGERVGAVDAALVALGFAGTVLVSWEPVGSGSLDGVAWGLVSGLSYASYILAGRAAGLRGRGGWLEIGVFSQPFALIGSFLVLQPHDIPSLIDVPWMLYTSIATTLLPYSLHANALRVLEAHRTAVLSLVEPVTAILLAYVVLDEAITMLQAVGALMVLAAAGFTSFNLARVGGKSGGLP